MRTTVLFCMLKILFVLHTDAQTIEGRILDKKNSDSIPSAHIYSERYGIGTISNENGEFSISLPKAQFPLELVISHISYESKAMIVNDPKQSVIVQLESNNIILEEVVVDARARIIAEKVKEILSSKEEKYGRVFYRQFTTTDTISTEFVESFYNIAYSKSGISKLKIKQARYARKKEGDFIFTNFPFLSFFPLYLKDSSEIKMPFSTVFDEYRFVVEEKYRKNNEEIVKVKCIPPVKTIPSDSNEVWLNAVFTFNVTQEYLLDYSANLSHGLGADNLIPLTVDSVFLSASNPRHSWYYSFSEQANHDLNYIEVDYTFDLQVNEEVLKATVNSRAVLFEKNTKRFRGLREPSLELEDLKSVSNVRYKKRFWKDNPIIKLTSEEEEIIQTFEDENAFGTYFK
ncbi:CarboxypepD_reg-like domain-containing protein [Marivirga sericea]|uniref:CarboxypepD_reg-like domain-containing protein n=1 Tax=Marivirga sericea TaxID=1028 RepID=A0A1X7KYA8_9BACT|nr:carboxypeptidase-like regulatory domain-containing protein [Marivirga sericea]SMG46551.1 CarboxypepD_reg-like domain-containing protein [Marivirga sericea]